MGPVRAVRWAGASIVFQGAMHSLNAVHRIGDQIAEPILLHKKATPAGAKKKVGELLEQVGLPAARAEAYPHELSGGQRQRVMIAMALACDPRLIIADEPTTALDVMIQAQILRLIEQLVADQDLGLIMISHDLAVLSDTCDRLAVMYAGRVVEEGPATEVYENAQHPYSKALSAAFPRIGDRRRGSRRAACPATRRTRRRCPRAVRSIRAARSRWTPAPRRTRSCGTRAARHRAACVHAWPSSGAADIGAATAERPHGAVTEDQHQEQPRMTTARAPPARRGGLHVTFPGRRGAAARARGGRRRPRHPARRDRRPGRRVGLRQDDAGPLAARPGAADVRAGDVRRQAARLRGAGRSRRTASGSSWCSRTPAAPSTPATRCTTRWRRDCASTGTRVTSGRRSPTRCRGPDCGPPERFFLRYPHELSGGQRQRVVIAGALVLEPELIVADEPVASLDASVRGEILALLLRLRDELGLSALVVTHDLGLAWNIADRVAVMYLGRIVETGDGRGGPDGSPTPVHPGAVVGPAGGRRRAGGPHGRAAGPVPKVPSGCRFHARCQVLASGEAERAGVADALPHEGPAGAGGRGETQVACHWATAGGRASPAPDRGLWCRSGRAERRPEGADRYRFHDGCYG